MTDHPLEPQLPLGKLPGRVLADHLARFQPTDPAVIVGPGVGRDAAAMAVGGAVLVAKSDPITFASHDAAAYLIDVNANDLACLGATPRWLLVTALFPEYATTEAMVAAQFADLHAAAARRGVAVVGGHTEITAGLDRPILVGTMLGLTAPDRLLPPGGARPGNVLLLTKALAIEGTALLAAELRDRLGHAFGPTFVDRAADLLRSPGISVVDDAQAVLALGGVTALHDPTEGGLATGVRELAAAAACGARLDADRVPLLEATRRIAGELGLDPLGMLASGSLLVAAERGAAPRMIQAAVHQGIEVASIGEILPPERGFSMVRDGRESPLPEFPTDEVARALRQWTGGKLSDTDLG